MDGIEKNFGILIAFGLPGFLFLAGLPPELQGWLAPFYTSPPTLGGFLYALPGSLACGLILSGVRWAVIDSLVHLTGIRKPRIAYGKLAAQLPAFTILVEHHYRYYQFYSNTLIASLALLVAKFRVGQAPSMESLLWLALFCGCLFAASRDCLSRYYTRIAQVLPGTTCWDND